VVVRAVTVGPVEMPDSEEVLRQTRLHCQEFLGLDEADALERADRLGLSVRTIAPGDAITADLRPRRVTLTLIDGEVTGAFAG
jgi:hypothetical protein